MVSVGVTNMVSEFFTFKYTGSQEIIVRGRRTAWIP